MRWCSGEQKSSRAGLFLYERQKLGYVRPLVSGSVLAIAFMVSPMS